MLKYQSLCAIAAACLMVCGNAYAQNWSVRTDKHPITDAPVASAAVQAGNAFTGWRLVAWCGTTDERGMRWQIYVDTKDIIDSNSDYADLNLRFDSQEPSKLTASIGGDYSNVAILIDNEDATAHELLALVERMRSASKLAIQIDGTARVFSMSGSSNSLNRWVKHCSLDEQTESD
jgi:hypothetical protein